MKLRLTSCALLLLLLSSAIFGNTDSSNNTDVQVRFSIDNQIISEDDDGVEVRMCVRNVGTDPVVVILNEPARLAFHEKKKELSLGFERDISEYHVEDFWLALVKPNETLTVNRTISSSLFNQVENGRWKLNTAIGYVLKKDFEKAGFKQDEFPKDSTSEKTKKKFSYGTISIIDVQHIEVSNEVSVKLRGNILLTSSLKL